MFASFFVFLQSSSRIRRALQCVAFGSILLANAVSAAAAPLCKPALAFQHVSFSPIDLDTMQRRWAVTLSVDASACASASGKFEILFELWSETAPDDDLIRNFTWTTGVMTVAFDLMAQEAIGGYRLQAIAACPCRQ